MLIKGGKNVVYKVVVIGGGPGGYVAAIRAAQMGAQVALVEKNEVGGTCLNRGCIPTKALVSGTETLHKVRHAKEYGIFVGEVTIDVNILFERKNRVVGQLVEGIKFLLKKNKIDLIKGVAKIRSSNMVLVATEQGEIELETENIIVATGTEPFVFEGLNYDGDLVITSNEALNLTNVPKEMIIIGGGVIGCEFACIFNALGSKVTVIEMMPNILPLVDKEAARQLQSLLKKQGINVKTKVKIEQVNKSDGRVSVVLDTGEELSADKILVSIGRKIISSGLGLTEAGVELGTRGEIKVNSKLRTNVPSIYAVGDVTGQIQLAHVASAQGLVAVDNIMGKTRSMDYSVVPSCIFTYPEVAGVGLTGQEAKDKGINVKSGKFPFMACGKALAMGESEGFVKVLSDPNTDKILGVHIVGAHATDLIAEAALAMQTGVTVKQLTETIHAHPTLAEAVMEAAEAVHGMSIHM